MAETLLGRSSLGMAIASVFEKPIDWLKNTLTFRPNPVVHALPDAYGLSYEEVWFGGPDQRTLHGWYFPQLEPVAEVPETLFIWFHGNAGNVAHRLSHLRLLYEKVGGSHFLFDYRGYGRSRGKPTIQGVLADARGAISFAWKRGWATGRTVVYFGESLGCAVIVSVATDHPPDRVILSAPFYSLRAMGQLRLPLLAFLVDGDFNSARLIGQLPAPLLVIHGTDDPTVPFQQGKDLYALAPQPKTFHAVPGGGHVNLHDVGGETYLRVIRDFLL